MGAERRVQFKYSAARMRSSSNKRSRPQAQYRLDEGTRAHARCPQTPGRRAGIAAQRSAPACGVLARSRNPVTTRTACRDGAGQRRADRLV